ncbi:YihY/virulence factor BrkB family protein [Bizionia gelidisalsuginis]|uniref:YihY/virulence factor BrkB family protein n=1 Tax=Bizionia gelidisalsuginis TaxID=291188 RepID=A0ABY3MBD6_9FLAO|nr:YihY/virulence factor BrkB family protein [Bizionia gelidisalsuginis]TYC14097.1 YihY/virulence factor BrkB family protein [Bizionia gelidisalsuginis]
MKIKQFKIQHLPKLLLETAKAWYNSEPFKLSAVVAYYAILSLPALLIIIFNVVGNLWGREIVQGEVLDEISNAIGVEAAESIRVMLVDKGDKPTSFFATTIGIFTLLYGATGVFYQLENALDGIWKAKPRFSNGILASIFSRVKSFGFILIIGFLLLVSFVMTSLLSTFSKRLQNLLPENLIDFVFIIDIAISLTFIYFLFAAMFKVLPNSSIPWRAVKIGAALTAILFTIGKYLLAIYFNEMEPGSTYGAAGSVILIMLWVSYTSLILFFGAQFTKVYSDNYLTKEE